MLKHRLLAWIIFCCVISTTILTGVVAAHAATPSRLTSVPATVVLNGSQLAQIKQQLQAGNPTLQAELKQELAVANADLTAGPWSVMDKTTVPPSGSKHDYISLSRYYWPTPGSPNGCPYIHKDGQTNPATASNAYDHASRHAAMDAIFNLSIAWYYTGNQSYADRAELDVRTWFLNPATAMNPNVNYGEEIPCSRPGGSTGVLNWTEVMGELLDGLAILDSGAPNWTATDQSGMHSWLTAFLGWLQTNSLARSEASAANNHGTYYDVGVSALELYLGKTTQAKALVTASETRRINPQIAASGQQPQETARTNSWGYSNWNLEGMCRLAQTASHVGVNLWAYKNPKGGSIVKATDYLINAAEKGKSVWPFQQISPFDQTWPVSEFHAAADFAGDKAAGAAISQVPTPAGGDLWALLPTCVEAAIQTD
ncbi:MAG: alginate lyase family protein [Ktedonobacteraceae bacterium]|nr:alginate lyase family protein [Ktedonobacteraceae bacterium]